MRLLQDPPPIARHVHYAIDTMVRAWSTGADATAIWVLQIRRLPVSTIEDEFGAAHTRCCGGPVVVHDRDQRLQRIPVIPPRRLCQTFTRFRRYRDLEALLPGKVAIWTTDHDVKCTKPK